MDARSLDVPTSPWENSIALRYMSRAGSWLSSIECAWAMSCRQIHTSVHSAASSKHPHRYRERCVCSSFKAAVMMSQSS